MVHKFFPLVFFFFLFPSPSTRATQTIQNDSLTSLRHVKERAIGYMMGGEGTGEYRKKAVGEIDQWVEKYLEEKFKPLAWDESAALIMNQRLALLASDMQQLAMAFRAKGGRYEQNAIVKQRIVAGMENVLQYFNPETPRPGNWFQWLISLPRHLGATGLLMESELPPSLFARLRKTLRHELTTELILTGTNASWEARNHIYLALLDDDRKRLERAADYVFRSVRYGPDQGIREDYCYLFHGRVPYAGGYGAGFGQTVAEFVYVFDGSPWAIAPVHRDIIRNLLLEHTRWFLSAGHVDMHIRGRSFKEGASNWNSILEALLVLAQTNDPRSHEVASTAAAMMKARPEMNLGITCAGFADLLKQMNGQLPYGFRYWPSGEIGVFRQKSFHIGFRQFSSRVQDYEYLAREDGGSGGEGWNLPYGFTNILRDDCSNPWYADNDTHGMLPEIDLEHLPGTTSRIGANPMNPPFRHDAKVLSMSTTGYSLNFGKSDFAGGAGWQDGGVAGFVLQPAYGDFSAKKSLHFFPGGYWALGTDIRSTRQISETDKNPVHTTILQWVSGKAKPVVKFSDKTLALEQDGEKAIQNVKWFWIDQENVAVVFSEATNIFLRLKGRIITVWLDHGVQPVAARYAYAVLPDIKLEDTKSFVRELPFRPLRHDAKVHAVADKKREFSGIVFFEPDTCLGIHSRGPAIIYRRGDKNEGVFTLQDPLHQKNKLRLTINQLTGKIANPDKAVTVTQAPEGSADVEVSTVLGRVYRFGYGTAGKAVSKEPRQDLDLSSYRDFRVEAISDAQNTILTVHLPDEAVRDGYKISVHFAKSQRLHDFTEADVIDRPSPNTVRYRWKRKPAIGPRVFSEYLKQTDGRFNISLVTRLITTGDSFNVPVF